jgi:glycosyltransferase involved in cell wall biosynthesis
LLCKEITAPLGRRANRAALIRSHFSMRQLLLFLTPGIGLGRWSRTGTIGRELSPYREYLNRGWHVTIATFGRDESRPEAQEFALVYPPRPRLLFSLPWVLHQAIRRADILKTNQSVMAWWYVWAARLHGKAILLRCGYVAGEAIETTEGRTMRARLYQLREAWAFRNATFCLVPTETLRQWVLERYGVKEDRISVLPNFIDTTVFKPLRGIDKPVRSVISVGNMTRVKNFELLVKACARAGASRLTLYGDGPERTRLAHLARNLGLELNLPGRIPNEDLPQELQAHAVYAQTSSREGHPKSLLEAMACGMPCIGTRVPGTQDTIDHEKTGILCDMDVDAVALALERLFTSTSLCTVMGRNAASMVRERFSFDQVFEREHNIVKRIIDISGKTK